MPTTTKPHPTHHAETHKGPKGPKPSGPTMHKGGAKSKKASKQGSKKTKKAPMPEGMAWCVACKKIVKMVNPVKVNMKMKGGKTRERYSAKDEHGHKVSRII